MELEGTAGAWWGMTQMLDLRVLAPAGLFYLKLIHDCLALPLFLFYLFCFSSGEVLLANMN